jgi:hypothetical protein
MGDHDDIHHLVCEILDQLRLEITYQYAINHIDPYEGWNNIVHAQESGYLPIRIGGRVRIPYDINTSTRIEVRLEDSHIYVRRA